ncbi:MAG: MmcQ/YjbR family DNA-binding protein [Saprospiraceae bacterium]|nr:MmcQ/YjbR family DNA-binding protein [Saprospiraceae bacterium]
MHIEDITNYCLSKQEVTHSFPFGGDTLVFKVMGKMFLLTGLESIPASINVKCDPEWAIELRESYEDIIPGYHMSKVHWNTVSIEGSLEDSFIFRLIDHSYDLVVASLPKRTG